MANNVTTTCTVTGPAASLAAFQARMFRPNEEEKGEVRFDFERILPKPDCIRATEKSCFVELGLIALGFAKEGTVERYLSYPFVQEEGVHTEEDLKAWVERTKPEALENARLSVKALVETGYADEYSWACAVWGTKWNAYDGFGGSIEDGELSFGFDTAWGFPMPVFEALAKAFPDLVFSCACFDDGWGFAGSGEFNGKDDFALCEASDELYELVFGEPPDAYDEDSEDEEDFEDGEGEEVGEAVEG